MATSSDKAADGFKIARDRDAYAAIRGFIYQIDHTIVRWIELGPDEILHLEAGEDIDVVAQTFRDSHGSVSERARELNQIKCLDRNITLKSPAALSAVANAVDHRAANPGALLSFRFCTNARPVSERPSPFEDRLSAIDAWEDVRRNELPSLERDVRVSGICHLLTTARKPPELPQKAWDALQRLVGADNELFVSFIKSFEWSTGHPSSKEMVDDVRRALLNAKYCRGNAAATEVYPRLFVCVARLLTQQGRKILGRDQLLQQIELKAIDSNTQQLVAFLETHFWKLDLRIEALEQTSASREKVLAVMKQQMDQIAEAQGIASYKSFIPAPTDTQLPPKLPALCVRQSTIDALSQSVGSSTWIAFHGATGAGKTQLSILLAQSLSDVIHWVSFRDLDCAQSHARLQAILSIIDGNGSAQWRSLTDPAQELQRGSVVVLDDVPLFDGDSEFASLLMVVVSSFAARGVRIVSSSHHRVPSRVVELAATMLSERLVPPFTAKDATDLFVAYGAAAEFCTATNIASLNFLTEGHPALLTACARFLRTVRWNITDKEWSVIREMGHATQLVSETVRTLLSSVSDASARELLYRLGLILGEFRNNHVRAISAVPPAIDQPIEKMTQLLGLWVEQRTYTDLAVSPLVKPLSHDQLCDVVRVGVFSSLADLIIQDREISPIDVTKAAYYLERAGLHNKAALFRLVVLNSAEIITSDQKRFVLHATGLWQSLSDNVDLDLRVCLLARQIKMANDCGIDIKRQLEVLETLLGQCSAGDSWAVFTACTLLVFVAAQTDFDMAARFTRRANSAYLAMVRNPKKQRIRIRGYSPGFLMWALVASVRTADDVLMWLRTLGSLSASDRQAAFRFKVADDGSKLLVDKTWMSEHEKPKAERKWKRVLKVLDRIIRFARRHHLQILWAPAVAARIVVLGEYVNDIDAALSTAEHTLKKKPSARSRFLICDAIGRQFIYQSNLPVGEIWMRRALAENTRALPGRRVWALLELAKAVGSKAEEATTIIDNAVALARANLNLVGEKTLTIALGELGIARWRVGDMPKAFEAMDEAMERMLDYEKQDDDWKQRIVAIGHVVGYLAQVANQIDVSEARVDEQPYILRRFKA